MVENSGNTGTKCVRDLQKHTIFISQHDVNSVCRESRAGVEIKRISHRRLRNSGFSLLWEKNNMKCLGSASDGVGKEVCIHGWGTCRLISHIGSNFENYIII